jgi:hypothetical protein
MHLQIDSMKKLIFTNLLALVAGLTFGQTLIPKAGATFSKFGGSDEKNQKFNVGFTLGMGFNLPLGAGPFSIQPELNFIQKGSEDNVTVVTTNYTTKFKLNYLEVPVLLKASFGAATKIHINAGPSIAVGLGGKVKATQGSDSAEFNVKFGEGDDAKTLYYDNKMDFGLQFGGGVTIAEIIMLDIRYGAGLSTLIENASVKNNVLQFTVGVPINLK